MFKIEPNLLKVTHVDFIVPQWTEKNYNIKMAVIADLHAKPKDTARIKKLVEKVQKQNPDLIVFLGDYVNGHLPEHTMSPQKIAFLLKPLVVKCPCFAVLGNHDLYYGKSEILKEFEFIGIQFVENKIVDFPSSQNSILSLAGFPYVETMIPAFIIPRKKENDLNPFILLTHSPDILPCLPGNIDLTLCGHTHGGQICLPGGFPLKTCLKRTPKKFSRGLNQVPQGGKIFVSKGIGTSILPIRFWAVPEVVIVHFHNP